MAIVTRSAIELGCLAEALGLGAHEHVAIVGGGGKTTTLHALAQQLNGSKVVTTTTKMGHDQNRGLPVMLSPTDQEIAALTRRQGSDGTAAMVWKATVGTKAIGADPEDCDRWFGIVDHVLVEADGARRRPFKAPGPFEPVVPASTTMLLSIIGSDALGRVIGDQCHRPLRVAALAGCRPYERLTPERAAAVLLHERGAAASRPGSARMAIIITKVDETVSDDVDSLVAALDQLRSERDATADVATVTVASGGLPV